MNSKKNIPEKDEEKFIQVAKSLRKAMKGFGTDENRIIRELLSYKMVQRQIIKNKFKLLTGKDLEDELESELSGYFREAVLALLTPVDDFEASILKEAICGLGTDESKVIQILCTKNGEQIKQIKSAYRRLYRRELEADLSNEESGHLGRIFRSLATGGRAQNHGYDLEYVEQLAQKLYDSSQGRLGTNEDEFISILCARSFPELNCILAIYKEKFAKDLTRVIRQEFSGHLAEALITIAKCAVYKPAYYADLLYESLRKDDNFERDLLQVVLCRVDVNLFSESSCDQTFIPNKYLANQVVNLNGNVRKSTRTKKP
ncbi:unnamed protein product, partial [Brachionus calyciflorus]